MAPLGKQPRETPEVEAARVAASAELDELESQLTPEPAAGDLELGADSMKDQKEDDRPTPAASGSNQTGADAVPDEKAAPVAEAGAASSGKGVGRSAKGFGASEWAALAACGGLAVVGGLLFVKFMYTHPAPFRGADLPMRFNLPLAGPLVRLSGAEAAWRDRQEGDVGRIEEAFVPTLLLTLDPGQTSSGFVRVEFVDSEDRIRGDVMTVAIEGGRFRDDGRGEVVEEGGTRVRLTGTVGFRSEALFASYLSGEEPRWLVRVKAGPDSANGPWTDLGAARIPNRKL
ncbi:MAG: hypothetical protein ACKV19_04185 [Verrucomicrobiales bacterium]